ncbi:hypothetical protein TSAR_005718 [Trichomalopsis sarcophagae]|uniref:Uncharacterized protein n=1 Tax=Trichomalopsis sarcophagae TaxID=543379 RepID=A0A232F9K0_9HYME|nr:hypothetical protein TSAR_005718 [Trichomalopsis sarcophagae]
MPEGEFCITIKAYAVRTHYYYNHPRVCKIRFLASKLHAKSSFSTIEERCACVKNEYSVALFYK